MISRSRISTNETAFVKAIEVTLFDAESHSAEMEIGPAGDSIVKLVIGNVMFSTPHSRTAVAAQIVLWPDIRG